MENFLAIIFYKLLYMSIIASIIGFTIIIAKRLLAKQISPKITYIMWGIFLIALAVPMSINTRFSIYNYIDLTSVEKLYDNVEQQSFEFIKEQEAVRKELEEYTVQENESIDKAKVEIVDSSKTDKNVASESNLVTSNKLEKNLKESIKQTIPIAWFVVMIFLFSFYIISSIVFKFKIGKQFCEDERIEVILEACKKKIKVRKKLKLIKQNVVKTPAIIGIFKPVILITEDFQNFSDEEIEYVFRHELSHYKRKDNFINLLLIILKTIHWFNPLVWFIMKEIRKDMEFAADEMAVKDLENQKKKDYCKLLVELARNSSTSFMEKAIGIADDKSNLEKRIKMVKLSDNLSKHPIISASLVFIIIGLICLILYTNNYYIPAIEEPPTIYIKDIYGNTKELLLTKYDWLYNGEMRSYDIDFDMDNYTFDDKNTLIVGKDNEIWKRYTITTSPKYRISIFDSDLYNLDSYDNTFIGEGGFYMLMPKDTKFEIERQFSSNNVYVEVFQVTFANGCTAKYAFKYISYQTLELDEFRKYKGTEITDIGKIKELLGKMELASFLIDVKSENNSLYLSYKYNQGSVSANEIAKVLFAIMPNLERVYFTSEHSKATTSKYNQETGQTEKINFDGTVPVEITRDKVEKDSLVKIEDLIYILNKG